jgi:sugar phosphate isomerase/epimerase
VTFKDRIGVDVGRRLTIEDAVAWAGRAGLRHIDVQIDVAPNALESFDEARCAEVRALCQREGVRLGLHTSSAVNTAEYAPFLREAADQYLKTYVEAARRLGAGWVDVHAGYHFTSDRTARMEAALERLRRAVALAEQAGVTLFLENLNREPDHAEVRYLAHDVEECRYFFDRLTSPSLRWTFTVNHATLVPEGIAGFIAGMPMERCAEVRLADNHGRYEQHLRPGEGIIDFADLFRRLEGAGFQGHFTCAFGTLEDMLAGREVLARAAPEFTRT